jgi:predicted RNA-binding Zn-ribbon protein involved in translation (DUF1610 family)
MSAAERDRCPSCGAELPRETGQHAVAPSADAVVCPSCGATVRLGDESTGPEGDVTRATGPGPTEGDYFSGEETVSGVMEELDEKEGGP